MAARAGQFGEGAKRRADACGMLTAARGEGRILWSRGQYDPKRRVKLGSGDEAAREQRAKRLNTRTGYFKDWTPDALVSNARSDDNGRERYRLEQACGELRSLRRDELPAFVGTRLRSGVRTGRIGH
ncbi:hypothetical protein FGB62_129g07 [Gracilaria domingensis]|nr:hypothetical protein FGB62_129g07 [Gracilaria domingensis]